MYRVKNWSSYNRALVARGSLTVWLDDSFWRQWYDHRPSQRGAQFVYSDSTIEWMLTVRVLLRLPLRQTQGFIQSLWGLMSLELAAPDYLKARTEANQQVESRLGCAILNRMIHLGKPESYRIEKSN